MNAGWLLLLTVVGTIGAAIVVTIYRDLIFPQEAPAARRRPRPRPRPAPQAQAQATETKPKRVETVSDHVSPFVMPENDAEMIAYFTIAKLVEAKCITETAALSTVFGVKAGKSKAYIDAQAKLKIAQAKIAQEKIAPSA